ncbi:ABC transporter substrate-binding protein [Ancylobacter mangrovi]|uniref:ABC transporter substrate-binding protein n=1 Tax=Ancylobacter mangrovi TaxID=2972472 RepID=A0A9X2T3K5_9HYPH|nr:ABC transporter substrate-binding protein [Ancylobacter mangrovi]MCS0497450.1 ABC transporter substrate-binding protein [Ancylobacter mangrovi]MCS0504000.1 ABC transporter substrate-binding protein [Ancylobacter mangrovi]
MKISRALTCLAAGATLATLASAASAADLQIVSGAVGRDIQVLRENLDRFEKMTGNKVTIVEMPSSSTDQFAQYRLWLSAGNSDIDVYRTDIIWAPQIAAHLLDLSKYEKAAAAAKEHFPSIIQSQTVNGKLVALPYYTDAPALFYRKDLLEKYKLDVPKTWDDLAKAAKTIQDGERKAGAGNFQGYVFQAAAYEGLTCNGLEWLVSHGAGHIVEADGTISVNNPKAAAALEQAASWIGTISPEGVLGYKEEEARGVWQTGNAAFMRNWPYAYALSNSDDSAVKGKFGVAALPSGGAGSAATLGGWNLAVSKYSKHPKEAVELVLFLTSAEAQKMRAIENNNLPTRPALYEDQEILKAQPSIGLWKDIFNNSTPRPSAATKADYNEVSKEFWDAVHATLAGKGSAKRNLARLEARLKRLKGSGWK